MVAVAGDITDPGHRRALVDEAGRLGGLDLLVNNASRLGPSPQPNLTDYPSDELRAVFEANVLAPAALTREAAVLLRDSPNPRVVNVTSDASVEAYDGWGGYGASKAALDHLERGAGGGGVRHPGVGDRSRGHENPDAAGGLPR